MRYVVAFLAAFLSAVFGIPTPAEATWTNCRTLTFDHTQVPNTDQTDFPVLVSDTVTAWKVAGSGGNIQNTTTQTGGGDTTNSFPADLIFIDSTSLTDCNGSPTKLKWEWEKYVSTTGVVVIWIKIPTLKTASDTTIVACYNDSGTTTWQGNVTGTWNSGYVLVWHGAAGPADSSMIYADSTSNGNTVTLHGANNTIGAGKIGGEIYFNNGNNDNYLDAGNNAVLDLGNTLTMSTWVKWNSLGGQQPEQLMCKGNGGSEAYCFDSSSSNWRWFFRDSGGTPYVDTGTAAATGNYDLIVATYDHATQKLYQNATLKDSNSVVATPTTNTHILTYGARQSGSTSYDITCNCHMDEWRVSNVTRLPDWISTEYNNQNAPASFVTIGGESSSCGGGGATNPPPNGLPLRGASR